MGKATSMALRKTIVSYRKSGKKLEWIAEKTGASYVTVQKICKKFSEQGDRGLETHYGNCGKSRPTAADFIFRSVRCLRAWHPTWGAPKIRSEMLVMRPDLDLPTVRTMQNWLKWNGQVKPKTKVPKEPAKWADAPNEGWQIDAKEGIRTRDGQAQTWLNIKDESSGAVIDPAVFPPEENFSGSR